MTDRPTDARPLKNWLQEVLDDAARKVAAWPEWKRQAYKAEMERLKKEWIPRSL